jgi:hypothetical protein
VLAVLTTLVAVLGVTALLLGTHERTDLKSAQSARLMTPASATVVVASRGRTVAIPRSFLGFSTEYWTLPVDERHVALYRRAISLVHPRSDGRFVLRIGGVSSDHSFWQRAVHRLPPWAFLVTPRWIVNTAKIVRQSRLRVILDLNLVTATSALDASLAREAQHELPHGSISAFEIGNEPDVYNQEVWGFRLGDDRLAIGLLPRAITARTYTASFDTAARALAAVAPRVPLQGPALARPRRDRSWISRLLAGRHPRLDAISVHEYPYTACANPDAADYPTIGKLLSAQATAGMAAAVRPAVRIARRVGLPVRVSEFNSVTCGGVPGVSDTFATALWAPSALFALIRAGVSAADLHVRAFSDNAPFSFDRRGAVSHPLLYGLILFTRMLGANSHLVRVRVHASKGVRLRAWAVRRRRGRLSVLLIDGSARTVKVNLEIAGRRDAIVHRLLAPSADARTGETLDGQWLGSDLRWHGRRRVQIAVARKGRFAITVTGTTAALITLS